MRPGPQTSSRRGRVHRCAGGIAGRRVGERRREHDRASRRSRRATGPTTCSTGARCSTATATGSRTSCARRMSAARPGRRFDVVVTFRSPASLHAARRAMTGVASHVRRSFSLIPGFQASLTARQVHDLFARGRADPRRAGLHGPRARRPGGRRLRHRGRPIRVLHDRGRHRGVHHRHRRRSEPRAAGLESARSRSSTSPPATRRPRTTTTGTARTWRRSRSATEPAARTPPRTTALRPARSCRWRRCWTRAAAVTTRSPSSGSSGARRGRAST